MMTFNSYAAQRVVAAVVGRTEDRDQKPLTGRIKHLGRQGFPAGTNVQQGNSIAHTAQALSHLVVALMLIDRHVAAGAVVACINAHRDVVNRFVLDAVRVVADGPDRSGSLVIAAGALASLGQRKVQATSVGLSVSPDDLDGIVIDARRFGRSFRSALSAEGVTSPDFLDALKADDEVARADT